MWRHVAEVNVEAMFPQQLAGIGVKAHDALLLRLALARDGLQVNVIAHPGRRGASAVRNFPREVLAGWGPFLGQVLFIRDAVARWPAPVGPVACNDDRECKTEVQIYGDEVDHFRRLATELG